MLFAIRVHENGSVGKEFGCKKFKRWSKDAQYVTAVSIVSQEVEKFIELNRIAFVNQLANRWNEEDSKNWSKSVLKIWEGENVKK